MAKNNTRYMPNVWTHVALTYSPRLGIVGYENGEIHATGPTVGVFNCGQTKHGKVLIGADSKWRADDSMLDELIFFNTRLSHDDVKKLYNQHK